MSTATATPETEQLVAPRETSVLFMSRRSNLRLVKTPIYPQYGPGGGKVGDLKGETVEFTDGTFRCPPQGEIVLADGRKADAAEILAWLESHMRLKDTEDGFWRVDPSAPAPTPAEIDAIVSAATEFDEDRLAAIVEQERAGWAREAILDPAERGLERMREIKAKAAADAEQRAAEEAAKAKADAEAKRKADAEAQAAAEAAKAKAKADAAAAGGGS